MSDRCKFPRGGVKCPLWGILLCYTVVKMLIYDFYFFKKRRHIIYFYFRIVKNYIVQ